MAALQISSPYSELPRPTLTRRSSTRRLQLHIEFCRDSYVRKLDRVWNAAILHFLTPLFVHVTLRQEFHLALSIREKEEIDVRTDLVHLSDGLFSIRRP